MAKDNGIDTLANMIIVGKILNVLNDFDNDSINATLGKVISAKRADMLDTNLKALKIGAEF